MANPSSLVTTNPLTHIPSAAATGLTSAVTAPTPTEIHHQHQQQQQQQAAAYADWRQQQAAAAAAHHQAAQAAAGYNHPSFAASMYGWY